MKHLSPFGFIIILLVSALNLSAAEEENNWPKQIEKSGATIIIYQPQVESFTENKLESRAAVSVTNQDNPTPVFGAMWFDCKVSTDRDERTVLLLDMVVTAAKFPDIDAENIKKLSGFLENEVPNWEMVLSLDQLLADLDMNEVEASLSEGLNNAPPDIIYSTTPTMLILIDGDPVFEEIENSGYERVVNTPYFVVKDSKKKNYYINGGEKGTYLTISIPGKALKKFPGNWSRSPKRP